MKEIILPIQKNKIPFGDLLMVDYQWVDDFIRSQDLQGKIVQLRKERENHKDPSYEIDRELAELQADLSSLSPKKFFLINEAEILCDIREEFVSFWRNIQAMLNAPAGPEGRNLTNSPKPEREAWTKLNLKESVIRQGKKPII